MKILALLFLFLASPSLAASRVSLAEIRDWGDFLFLRGGEEIPEELKDPRLTSITREFGQAVVPLRGLPYESETAETSTKPWSSWWFPRIDRDLFDDGHGTSPFEKYDLWRAKLTKKPSRAAAFERSRYRGDGPHWEGLCDAWAIAATLYPEPLSPRAMRLPSGKVVTFSVGDQKALLLKTLDSVPEAAFKVYGQRFTGNQDGWIFPDLFPQELHRYLQVQLFEKHKMFIMDHDPGLEVWSEPVYKANYVIQAVPGRSDAVFVKLWLYSATSFPTKAEKNSTGTKELVREYDYLLYGKPDEQGNNLLVTGGTWVKGDLVDSRRDHPDFVYEVADPAALVRQSQNPEIDSALVDRILGR